MSEYQYYEFQAIDRPLGDKEMRALRALSSRATITPTSFQNTYNSGDFKGSPATLMAKYFDAFVHVTNWGTRQLMLRLPRRALDMRIVKACCAGESASLVHAGSDQVVVAFTRDDDAGGDWEDGDGWLSSLLPLRTDLLRGDLRVMYLAWLMCAQRGDLDEDAIEPAPPPGLGQLSASLAGFAEFFAIDPKLIEAAAERSKPMTAASARDLAAWIAGLPEKEKNELLLRQVRGAMPDISVELRRRFDGERAARASSGRGAAPPRTVRELLADAEARSRRRRRQASPRRARQAAFS